MTDDALLDVSKLDRAAQQRIERRNAPIGNSARDDQAEVLEVSGRVERESMARDPAGNADADRCELVLADPDAGQSVDAMRADAVVARGAYQDLLEIAN